jgi:hypothetical protein
MYNMLDVDVPSLRSKIKEDLKDFMFYRVYLPQAGLLNPNTIIHNSPKG